MLDDVRLNNDCLNQNAPIFNLINLIFGIRPKWSESDSK